MGIQSRGWFRGRSERAIADFFELCEASSDKERPYLSAARAGDWQPLEQRNRETGARYAREGIAGWPEVAFGFYRAAVPRFVSALIADPDRLSEALLALGEYQERSQALIARAYYATGLQPLELQHGEVLAASLDSVISIDADGRVVEFNAAASKTFGFAREDAVGRILADLIIPERFRDAHRAGLARVMTTGETHVIGPRRARGDARGWLGASDRAVADRDDAARRRAPVHGVPSRPQRAEARGGVSRVVGAHARPGAVRSRDLRHRDPAAPARESVVCADARLRGRRARRVGWDAPDGAPARECLTGSQRARVVDDRDVARAQGRNDVPGARVVEHRGDPSRILGACLDGDRHLRTPRARTDAARGPGRARGAGRDARTARRRTPPSSRARTASSRRSATPFRTICDHPCARSMASAARWSRTTRTSSTIRPSTTSSGSALARSGWRP